MSRILIVDDDLVIRRSVALILNRKCTGHEYDCAASGPEALEILKQRRVDLIIADLHRPQENCMEFISEALRIQADVVFVVLTGYGCLEDARQTMLRGASAYLTKPFAPEATALLLRELLAVEGQGKREKFHVQGVFWLKLQ